MRKKRRTRKNRCAQEKRGLKVGGWAKKTRGDHVLSKKGRARCRKMGTPELEANRKKPNQTLPHHGGGVRKEGRLPPDVKAEDRQAVSKTKGQARAEEGQETMP